MGSDGAECLAQPPFRDGAQLAKEMGGLPIELMRRQRAIPSYYLRYYYLFDEVLREQREGHSRAA